LPTISLPNNWQPRWYQRPLWDYLEKGGRRAIAIWHRRAGKDEVILHRTAVSSFERVGNRWHCLPEYEQARKAIWEAVNPHTGKRRIDEAFPPELRERMDSQSMFIQFKNGSTWQLIGSDRYNATVGAAPVEITYSEFALANPSAWAYHRPMLEENNGVASFITTPRGNNHAKALYDMAKGNKNWFAQVLTARDTGALSEDQLDESLKEYQALYGGDFGLAMFEQEYLCSFSGAMVGAYWGAEVNRAEREGRVYEFEVDPEHPVHTAWDLGKSHNNPIWCFQVISGKPRIVDFYLPDSDDLIDWVEWLDLRGYHGNDYVPHDIIVTEWGSKRTRLDVLRSLGRNPVRLAMVSVADGLQAGRATINDATFINNERVLAGIEGLKNYRRDWDDERKTFRETPVKDWAEHIGSAFRYLGLAWKQVQPRESKKPEPTELQYQVMPDGRVVGNMDVRQAVDAMMKRKRRLGR
jgi:hypothetical protein